MTVLTKMTKSNYKNSYKYFEETSKNILDLACLNYCDCYIYIASKPLLQRLWGKTVIFDSGKGR